MKLLLVEDDREIQEMLGDYLRTEAYEVVCASNGRDACRLFDEGGIGLVLLDLMIPQVSGMDVMEHIRKKSVVPIIILSARDTEADKTLGLGMGADDYITKPFSVKLVLMRVEAVLRRAKEREVQKNASILSCGNIRLDRESHSVSAGGRPVSLTHTEYGLLELFMLHPGRVFTRDNLLNHVWGYDFVGEEKTVNIHIMNLRRKLNTDLIETIRGVGYRLGKKN